MLPASRRRHVAGAARIARAEQLRSEFAREAEEQEQSADEDGEDCPLDEEQRWQRDVWAAEMREAACDDAADEAAFVAGEEWDAWQARACATVDRVLAAAPPFSRPEPGDGPAPSAACGAEEAASEPRQQCQQFPGGDG